MKSLLSVMNRYFRRPHLASTRTRAGRRKPSRLMATLRLVSLEDRVAPASVAILGADSYAPFLADVKNTIIGTGKFTAAQVDTYDVSTSTPSLATLDNYSSVLVYSDALFKDSTGLGNNLASYVNQGHGVVTADLDFLSGGTNSLAGTWSSGGYSPFVIGGATDANNLSMGLVTQPGHPVMAGVSAFNGGATSLHSTGGLAGASLVASWTDGQPLVAEKSGFAGRIIGLNFFPVSSNVYVNGWDASTQGGLLMANALQYTARSPYVVTTTADSGPGSLRDAITQINADTTHTLFPSASNPSVDEIDFNIAASDTGGGFNATTGIATITPQSALPIITNSVLIDGYTQSGARYNSNGFGQADNAILKVELSGALDGNASGLVIGAPNTVVRGLVINRFAEGIGVGGSASAGTQIEGNFIGLDPTGAIGEGNGYGVHVAGAQLSGTQWVTIGGTTAAERNVIAGISTQQGPNSIRVRIDQSSNVLVEGNYLGTDATGTKAISNLYTGAGGNLYLENGVSGVQIIGNVASGAYNNIRLDGNNSNVIIQGDRLGTTADGTAAITASDGTTATANGYGIYISDGSQQQQTITTIHNVTIGGTIAGAGNLISGNLYNGVSIYNGSGAVIQGNYIGTDWTGSYAIPNGGTAGVVVAGPTSANVTIGGTTLGARNVISGNQNNGIYFESTGSNIQVQGNYIGTNATGESVTGTDGNPLGNGSGIWLAGANGVTIGGTSSGARNVISGNGGNDGAGIFVGSSNNVTIQGNYLGTDATGNSAFTFTHINDSNIAASGDTNLNIVGNVISGGAYFGIDLYPNVNGVVIQGNRIGTNVAGTAALGNTFGIYMIQNIQNVTIGGAVAGAGNLISGNSSFGVMAASADCSNISLLGNKIGTDVQGTYAIPNHGSGAVGMGGSNVLIGVDAQGNIAGNLISGNSGDAIELNNPSGLSRYMVEGNRIGTDATGTQSLGNGGAGVYVAFGGNLTVGGTTTAAANTIAYNGTFGVGVASANNVSILGNSIHDNTGPGIDLFGGANDNEPAPVLTSVVGDTSPTISGTLATSAGKLYRIEFFASAAPTSLSNTAGQTLLGSALVTGDGTTKTFTASGLAPVPAGQNYFTATATVATPSGTSYIYGDTSAFSPYLVRNILTVTNPNDSGAGSLRAAITQANTDAALGLSDVITFASGMAGKTITLSLSSQLELSGSGTITIDASGLTSPLTISGNQATRVFKVDSGLRAELDNLTIVAGFPTISQSYLGGGIYNAGTLTLSGCTVASSTATKGGGIFNDGATLFVVGCTLSNDLASGGYGGGIYNNNGAVSVSGSSFSFDSAYYAGGGVANYGGTLALIGCTMTSNSASLIGGAIYNAGTLTTLSGCTLSGDAANNGSGAGIYNDTSGTVATLSSSTLSDNTATSNGGGVYNSGTMTTVSNCLFTGNTGNNAGGGIYNGGTLTTLIGCTLAGNKTANGGWGGGIYNSGTLTSVSGSALVGNSATNGGGIYNDTAGKLAMDASTVSGNSATNGGGIYNLSFVQGANVTNSTLSGNLANNGSGGGAYNGGFLLLSDCTLSANSAVNGGGVQNKTWLTLNGCTLSKNRASATGGGIYTVTSGATTYIQDQKQSFIAGNTAPSNPDTYGPFSGTPISTSSVTALTATVSSSGQINYTVQVLPAAGNGIPTGTVTLYDLNGNALASANITGSATISVPAILGSQTAIYAGYSGGSDVFGSESYGGSTSARLIPAVNALSTSNLQTLVNRLIKYWTPPSSALAVDASTAADAQLAANIIAGVGSAVPVTIVLRLQQGTYKDLKLSTNPNVTLVVVGGGKSGTVNGTTVVGNSPAVEIDGGNVVLADLNLTTDTDAPTLLVTGGDATVRDCTVDGSTGFSDPAIAVSGGSTVDLGTADSPGGNTITVTGTTSPIASTGTNIILAAGDTVEANDTPISVLANVALASSVNPSLLNQPVTFIATVSPPDSQSAAPTGSVTFLDQTTGNTLAVVSLSSGIASWSTSGLSVNAHTIAAIYSGDPNYLTSAVTLVQQVDYHFSGFSAPLNSNLAFGVNRTIPIKFQLRDFNGVSINGLGAIQSLQVLDSSGTDVMANAGSTTLRYDSTANQFIANWNTKGLAAGTYTVTLVLADGMTYTKTVQLSSNGSPAALLVDGSTTTTAAGALLGGDVELYVDNSNGDLSADELARIQDAVTAVDAVTEPYGVAVQEVSDPTLADVTLNMDTTSAVGSYADGVLGCTTDAGQITIIQGWNFYAGSDATQVSSDQYDFQTVVTHELGHALGLGHSADSASVMYASLDTGMVKRALSTADLNVADTDSGSCGLHAQQPAAHVVVVSSTLNPSVRAAHPGVDLLFAELAHSPVPTYLAVPTVLSVAVNPLDGAAQTGAPAPAGQLRQDDPLSGWATAPGGSVSVDGFFDVLAQGFPDGIAMPRAAASGLASHQAETDTTGARVGLAVGTPLGMDLSAMPANPWDTTAMELERLASSLADAFFAHSEDDLAMPV